MAIPDFQTLMLPLLRSMSDRIVYENSETLGALANEFSLSEEALAHMLPSGRQATFNNRVAWARSYLFQAGLIERVSRGKYRITERGVKVLKDAPERIDISFLRQFPEFKKFRDSRTEPVPVTNEQPSDPDATPLELMGTSYRELRQQLAQELLEEIKASPPSFFEQLVVDLIVAMGYGGSRDDAGQAVGRSGDGGIDGIIKEDRLGLDAIYLQAKRWENPVGRPEVQGFAGSLEGHRARKGIMITTSTFTLGAQEYVGMIEKKIVLIDGEQLAQLMIDYGIGVSEIETYRIHRIDSDYFIVD